MRPKFVPMKSKSVGEVEFWDCTKTSFTTVKLRCLGAVCAAAVDTRARKPGRNDERCMVKLAREIAPRNLGLRSGTYLRLLCVPDGSAVWVGSDDGGVGCYNARSQSVENVTRI